MIDIQEAKSDIEDAIILAMYASAKPVVKSKIVAKTKGANLVASPLDMFVTDKDRYPKRFYAFDASADSGDRVYTPDASALVVNPYKVCKNGIEFGLLDGGLVFKWVGIFPMARPRGITCLTNQKTAWFAYHYRRISNDGQQEYVKTPMAMTLSGEVCPLQMMGKWQGFDAKKERDMIAEQLALSMSIFEDAVRAGSYLATVKEHVEMMFPVGADAYKDFFAMRDGYKDTPTGRKNPILHWCATHLRKRQSGAKSEVKAHVRGASEFVCGPMVLTISENAGYGEFQ